MTRQDFALTGKKIGAYYGCMLLRPGTVMAMDDPENPQILEDFIRAIGAEPAFYPMRNECCGGYVTLEVRDIYKDVDFSFGASAEDLIRSRWSNGLLYIHQVSPWQYPVLSAKNYGMQNTGYSVGGTFLQIGLESWFFPKED